MAHSLVLVFAWCTFRAVLGGTDKWAYSPNIFPSVWFGADLNGPESTSQHRLETQYKSVYFGWQQSNSVSGCRHEEQILLSQIQAVRQLAPANVTATSTVAYASNAQTALAFYDWQRPAIYDQSMQGFFLADKGIEAGGIIDDCSNPGSKVWDWRNATARDYYIEHVIRPWTLQSAVDAIFIDEGDAVQCRWEQFPALETLQDVYDYTNGSVQVYRRAASILAAVGKRLVLSLKNGFEGAAPIEYKIGICPVQLDQFMDAMLAAPSAPFIRYHEYFAAFSAVRSVTTHPVRTTGSEQCTNLMQTATEQTQTRGVALSVHGGNYTAPSNLKLAFAAFMIVRNAKIGSHEDFFGWSTAPFWYSRDWRWIETQQYFTHTWGQPTEETKQDANGLLWSRKYEGGSFVLNCSTLEASIAFG